MLIQVKEVHYEKNIPAQKAPEKEGARFQKKNGYF
jgi:hypothetical protein